MQAFEIANNNLQNNKESKYPPPEELINKEDFESKHNDSVRLLGFWKRSQKDAAKLSQYFLYGLGALALILTVFFVTRSLNKIEEKFDSTEKIFYLEDELASAGQYDGYIYAELWQKLSSKTIRFLVFKGDLNNPAQISVQVGSWDSAFSDFANAFHPYQEQVGFFLTTASSGDQLSEVIFIPPGMSLSPSQVLTSFGLPTNAAVLQQKYTLPLANTFATWDKNKIEITSVLMSARSDELVSLISDDNADSLSSTFDGSLLLFADGETYASVWQGLQNKTRRFCVLIPDAKMPGHIYARSGPWDSTWEDFQKTFVPDTPQVGFYVMGDDQLFEIIYVPTDDPTPSRLLDLFGLPRDPAVLQRKWNFTLPYTYIANDLSNIDMVKVLMRAKWGGIINLISTLPAPTNSSSAPAAPALPVPTDASFFLADDGSDYSNILNDFKNQKFRYIIFKRAQNNPNKINVEQGPWEATFDDFASSFDNDVLQTGFIFIGTLHRERIYQVVYAPSEVGLSPDQIVTSFGLPTNPSLLKKFGFPRVHWFVATDKKEISSRQILLTSHPVGIIGKDDDSN